MYTKFYGKYHLSGLIKCVTSLHIGGTTTGVEIGGVDNPVIKDPLTDRPYIPGSSLKGKLRSISEWSLGLIERHPKHSGYQAYDCRELKNSPPAEDQKEAFARWQGAYTVGRLYGAASDENTIREKAGPTRLTIRDSFLDDASISGLQNSLGRGVFTEVKTENALDRVTSEANPRPIELVPAGSKFEFTCLVDMYDPADRQLLRDLFAAMRVLEHSSLGGSGSRGHGQISFTDLKLTWKSIDHYRLGTPEIQVSLPGDLESTIKQFDALQWPF